MQILRRRYNSIESSTLGARRWKQSEATQVAAVHVRRRLRLLATTGIWCGARSRKPQGSSMSGAHAHSPRVASWGPWTALALAAGVMALGADSEAEKAASASGRWRVAAVSRWGRAAGQCAPRPPAARPAPRRPRRPPVPPGRVMVPVPPSPTRSRASAGSERGLSYVTVHAAGAGQCAPEAEPGFHSGACEPPIASADGRLFLREVCLGSCECGRRVHSKRRLPAHVGTRDFCAPVGRVRRPVLELRQLVLSDFLRHSFVPERD
jgi:hypothetical protein